jgi:peroxiredoxin family protein
MANEIEQKVAELESKIKEMQGQQAKDQISIIAFSGDLDKMLAAMIIATGARAMDTEVKMFFYLLATAMLRDPRKNAKGKDFMSKMFGFMLPKALQAETIENEPLWYGNLYAERSDEEKRVASLEELLATAGELALKLMFAK